MLKVLIFKIFVECGGMGKNFIKRTSYLAIPHIETFFSFGNEIDILILCNLDFLAIHLFDIKCFNLTQNENFSETKHYY